MNNYEPEVYELLQRLDDGSELTDELFTWAEFCEQARLVRFVPYRDGRLLEITDIGRVALQVWNRTKKLEPLTVTAKQIDQINVGGTSAKTMRNERRIAPMPGNDGKPQKRKREVLYLYCDIVMAYAELGQTLPSEEEARAILKTPQVST